MNPQMFVLTIVTAATVAAAIVDVRTRRIPNALTLSLAAVGVLMAAAGWGRVDATAALAGIGVGLALMLPGYLLGATGGGDVKLVAAVGSLPGPSLMLAAFVQMAVAGAVIALVIAAYRGVMRQTIQGAAQVVATGGAQMAAVVDSGANNRFAYAPAIAVGAILATTGWWV